MTDTILVVVEQREGKLNNVSWETITAAQAIARQTGWALEAAVVGRQSEAVAGQVAAKNSRKYMRSKARNSLVTRRMAS